MHTKRIVALLLLFVLLLSGCKTAEERKNLQSQRSGSQSETSSSIGSESALSSSENTEPLGSQYDDLLPGTAAADVDGLPARTLSTTDELLEFAALISQGNHLYTDVVWLLDADLDMAGIDFSPIGWASANQSYSFEGMFDGQNHTIRNLSISKPGYGVGFFASITDGAVINLHLEGDVTGSGYVGGFAGTIAMSSLSNCSFVGNVSGFNEMIGGFAGTLVNANLNGCAFCGDVVGRVRTGGFAGNQNRGTLANCAATGHVKAYAQSQLTDLLPSAITGGIQQKDDPHDIGGLIGSSESASLIHCVTNAIVECYAGGSRCAAAIGFHNSTIQNCYYNRETNIWEAAYTDNADGSIGEFIGLTRAEMQSADSFALDFTNLWSIREEWEMPLPGTF